MVNVNFLRKLAADDLSDTLFFATGTRVVKTRSTTDLVLSAGKFDVKIISGRHILVNGDRCSSVPEAKYVIQETIHRDHI